MSEKEVSESPAATLMTARLLKERLYQAFSDLENARIILEAWRMTLQRPHRDCLRNIRNAQRAVWKSICLFPPLRESDPRMEKEQWNKAKPKKGASK